MKSRALFLSMLVGSAGWVSAQSDPFQRSAPTTALPALSGNSGSGGGFPSAGAAPAEVAQGRAPVTSFGTPRISGQDVTKVVFDLPAGARYVLSPAYSGLTVRVAGAPVQPESRGPLSSVVTGYQAGGNQVFLSTAHPLGAAGGWKATEATIASGNRVLILEFGESVQGGAYSESLRAMQPGSAVPVMADAGLADLGMGALGSSAAGTGLTSSMARANSLDRSSSPYQLPARPLAAQPQQSAPQAVTASYTAPVSRPAARPAVVAAPISAPTPVASSDVDSAPGDMVGTAKPQPLPPELADAPGYTSSADMTGRVPGASSNNVLTEPRIGKSPGMTRVVVDLPPGASYRIDPQGSGLNVAIRGVRAQSGGVSDVGSELVSWSYLASGNTVNLSLQTGSPTSASRGWRAFFLPPADSSTDRYRLAIDVAPALANLRPVPAQERRLSMLASLPPAGGLSYASALKPKVVLDPGHGGSDPGAMGSVQEKKIVLEVALRTRQFLNAAGIDVIMTRDRDMELHPNKATDLRMRANMGAAGYAFVSIHANAMPTQNALKGYGVETWYNGNHRLSPAFASILQKNLVDTSGAFSRGIKNYQSLAVLRTNRVPAALVEIGFVSHPVDSINLTDQNYIDRVALGIAKGIHESLRTGVHAAPSETIGQLPGNQAD